MENARCCHGKERFLKFDLNTLRRVLNVQNWLQIKKSNIKPNENISDFNELINYLESRTNDVDESLFTNLINFFKAISCLPHSSAAAERLFSHLTTMKTKYRNKLDVSICDALLLTKQILEDNNCYNWNPLDDLIKLM
jgi:hypothetical protein